MDAFSCPYLEGEVELSPETRQHVAARHPELLPEYIDRLEETSLSPDQVRRSRRADNAFLLSRWYADLQGGKHLVVVVLKQGGLSHRYWIVTAYVARRLAEGDVEWARS